MRIVLVGDIMLGRGVGPVAAGDPEGLFERVRYVVERADVAGGNLESPLTTRPHVASNPNDLTADPATAALLASAGFDVVSVANNHAGDAGRASVTDTVTAVESEGVAAVGGGIDLADALAPVVVERNGATVAFLAFDATRAGWPAGTSSPGIAHWDDAAVQTAVESAATIADLVVVSVHGGIEYLPATDPGMADLATRLAGWGVDVVWGHHSHVTQPVYVEGTTVVSTSLGNFLFDQRRDDTMAGAILEVLADQDGVVAYRVGTASHRNRRVRFEEWLLPEGDAVWLNGGWWTPVRPMAPEPAEPPVLDDFAFGAMTAAALGDVTGDGAEELVISYRHEPRSHLVRDAFHEHDWKDASGRTAHLAVFDPDDPVPLWAGGALFQPIAQVAACDGSVAVAFDTLDDPTVVATGAWTWNGFGFTIPPELPGPGTIGCADVDADGRLDPVITNRPG